jgi:hypothetical protein
MASLTQCQSLLKSIQQNLAIADVSSRELLEIIKVKMGEAVTSNDMTKCVNLQNRLLAVTRGIDSIKPSFTF